MLMLWLTFILTCCGRVEESRNTFHTMQKHDIVAGPGEETFAQRYCLKIGLPMSEAQFRTLLEKLHLRYDVIGDGDNSQIPPLRHSEAIDLSTARRCYQIYGTIDRQRHVAEMYRAYVDKNHNVVYVENAFSYTGP